MKTLSPLNSLPPHLILQYGYGDCLARSKPMTRILTGVVVALLCIAASGQTVDEINQPLEDAIFGKPQWTTAPAAKP